MYILWSSVDGKSWQELSRGEDKTILSNFKHAHERHGAHGYVDLMILPEGDFPPGEIIMEDPDPSECTAG